MTQAERRAVSALAGIFGLRMFGLFLILPVASLYAATLAGHTPLLIGLVLGAYGFTQALLQIPLGMLSDRYGRKPIIVAGLLVFAAGSIVAALADHIVGVIIGRALQGAGAIAAAVLALTADLTREEQRTKAMGMIGVTLGLAFMLALITGPLLAGSVGVPAMFWFTGALALAAIAVVLWWVPNPTRAAPHCDVLTAPAQVHGVLRDAQLRRLDFGIFVLHLGLTAMFVVVPVALTRHGGLDASAHWQIYLPVLLLSVMGMVPLMILSARTHLVPRIFAISIAILMCSQAVMVFGYTSLTGLVVGLALYFWGFNTLEAMLPSLVSRVAPAASKGTAIGVYNTAQFFGVFLGGAVGGWTYGRFGIGGVFLFCTLASVAWLLSALTAPKPNLFRTRMLRVGENDAARARAIAERLSRVPGVMEAVVVAEEGVAYLKVDDRALDEERLREFAAEQGT